MPQEVQGLVQTNTFGGFDLLEGDGFKLTEPVFEDRGLRIFFDVPFDGPYVAHLATVGGGEARKIQILEQAPESILVRTVRYDRGVIDPAKSTVAIRFTVEGVVE